MLVALLVAGSGWLVYIEEPEAHLHPRAIRALPGLFLDAIRRGAQVVVETHSELLLLSTQALVAEGAFANYTVRLNWLWRDGEGVSRCRGEDLDERGAFGDLPIDLDKVSLHILEHYLNAAIGEPRVALVVDTSVARAAGETTEHARACRDVLNALEEQGFALALSPALAHEVAWAQ